MCYYVSIVVDFYNLNHDVKLSDLQINRHLTDECEYAKVDCQYASVGCLVKVCLAQILLLRVK